MLTTLHRFNGTDGANPFAGVVQATNGNFYGTTEAGGADNFGTVFVLSSALGPFVETLPTSGKVGATVIILGNSLTGTTSVAFNVTPAKFTVVSSTEIKATVPVGATTGKVKVKTPADLDQQCKLPGDALKISVAIGVNPIQYSNDLSESGCDRPSLPEVFKNAGKRVDVAPDKKRRARSRQLSLLVAVSFESGFCCFRRGGRFCILGLRELSPLDLKQLLNRLLAVPDDRPQVAPPSIAGADNLSERNSFSCELGRDGAAYKAVVMKHADFAHIAGIEPEGHRFSYIGCKRRRNIAQPVEVNTIAMNSAVLRHLDQQQIQLFERLGHARQESTRFPAFGRRCFVSAHLRR